MNTDEQALIDFALIWEPFGGPRSEDLMTTFGLTHTQFRARVGAILANRGARSDRPLRQHARYVLRAYLSTTRHPSSHRPV